MKITFDLDGVILDSFDYICSKFNVDATKIDTYNLHDSDLPKSLVDQIFSYYKLGRVDEYPLYIGVDKIRNLHKLGAEIAINSLALSDTEASNKLEFVHRQFDFIKDKDIFISKFDHRDYSNKLILNTDIMVEDNLDNLINNRKSIGLGIIIDKPYNRQSYFKNFRNMIRVKNLSQALMLIQNILETSKAAL